MPCSRSRITSFTPAANLIRVGGLELPFNSRPPDFVVFMPRLSGATPLRDTIVLGIAHLAGVHIFLSGNAMPGVTNRLLHIVPSGSRSAPAFELLPTGL